MNAGPTVVGTGNGTRWIRRLGHGTSHTGGNSPLRRQPHFLSSRHTDCSDGVGYIQYNSENDKVYHNMSHDISENDEVSHDMSLEISEFEK